MGARFLSNYLRVTLQLRLSITYNLSETLLRVPKKKIKTDHFNTLLTLSYL